MMPSYYEYPRLAAGIVTGTAVMLQREPANLHAKAIAVLTTDGAKLGYRGRAMRRSRASSTLAMNCGRKS